MKKKFRITWELIQTGTSEIEARDLEDAKDRADENVDDFGDPEQFTPIYDNDGWQVKTIEEVI